MIRLRGDMEYICDPVVKDILRLVSQQVSHITHTKGKRINVGLTRPRCLSAIQARETYRLTSLQSIVLVGGFGNSDYLKRKLDAWCATNGGIKCIRPNFW